MKKLIISINLLFVLLMTPLIFMGQGVYRKTAAQPKYAYPNWDAKPIQKAFVLSLDGGNSTITGGDTDENNFGLSIHGGLGYYTMFWGFKFKLGYESLGGKYTVNNESFEAKFVDSSVQFHINAVDLILDQLPHRFNVCPHVGIGIIHQKTILYDADGNVAHKWGYSASSTGNNANSSKGSFIGRKIFSAQFGIEANYLITPEVFVYLDYSFRYADTKYLDGMCFNNKNDMVSTINLGIAYKIDLNQKKSKNNTGYYRRR